MTDIDLITCGLELKDAGSSFLHLIYSRSFFPSLNGRKKYSQGNIYSGSTDFESENLYLCT